jgi:acyl-CoA synthetase (AMP-forming)/AMP-acid ligase II
VSTEIFLSLLEARAADFLREISAEGIEEVELDFSISPDLQRQGRYLFISQPNVPSLWEAFHLALREDAALVLTGVLSPEAKAILLRQLPAEPPAEARLVLFTSGSTGDPKAVFHSEHSLLTSAKQLSAALPIRGTQLSLLQPWGMAGIAFHLLLPLFQGRGLVFHQGSFLSWAARFSELASDLDQVTLNPFLLEMLLKNPGPLPPEMEILSLTAPLSQIHREAVAARGGRLREIYGMSEAAGPVLLEGKSLGAQAKLSEHDELLLSGEQLFLGYGKEGSFESVDEWFSTGDIFVKDTALGSWQFVARERDLIDTGGRKVPPRLIEEIFMGMPEMGECLALPVVLQGCERAALLFSRSRECELGKEDLSRKIGEWARTSLSLDMRPFLWREVGELPRLPNGKVDKVQARKLLSAEKDGISSV